jgi:hypothetical protein
LEEEGGKNMNSSRVHKVIYMALGLLMVMNVTGFGAIAGGANGDEIGTNEIADIGYSPSESSTRDKSEETIASQGLEIAFDTLDGDEACSSVASADFHLPTVRQRVIELHPAFYTPSSIPENTTINLNLFDDASFTTEVHTSTEYVNEITAVRGGIDGFDLGFAVLSMGFGKVYGTIEIPEKGRRFIVQYDSCSNTHSVYEIDLLGLAEEPDKHAAVLCDDCPGSELLISELAFDPDPWEEVEVTVGVYYTPAARQEAGGEHNMLLKIANEVEISNIVFQASETGLTLNLVHAAQINYTESGSLGLDILRLRLGQEGLAPVHDYRDEHSADLVSLIVKSGDACGAAYKLLEVNDGYGEPDRGFSVVRQQCLSGDYTFAHEIGHNLGAHHHPSDPDPGPTDWNDWPEHLLDEGEDDNDWSAGHRWWILFHGHRTIMSYSPFPHTYTRIPRFSNPDVSYCWLDLCYETGTQKRSNARTIRITKHIVSSYRNVSEGVEGYVGYSYPPYGTFPLQGAKVEVVGEGKETFTNYAGHYEIQLQPGSYTVKATYLTFKDKIYHNVQVVEGEYTTLNFILEQEHPGFPIPMGDPALPF